MKKVKNTPAVEEALKSLPDVTRGRPKVWTPEEDAMILKYCPSKGMPAVASILNLKYESVRRRYNDLRGRA